jgi:hypothetical protein
MEIAVWQPLGSGNVHVPLPLLCANVAYALLRVHTHFISVCI